MAKILRSCRHVLQVSFVTHFRKYELTITFSALMTLQESRQNPALPIDIGDSGCPETLASTLIRLNYITARFNEKIEKFDLEAISPFPPRGISKAASIQYRLWKQSGDSKWLEASDSIKVMLSHFSKRWMNAGRIAFHRRDTL